METVGAQGPYQDRMRPTDPVSWISVSFEGLKRVDPHVLLAECDALRNAKTLDDVQGALQDTHEKFAELRLFKEMKATINAPEEGLLDVVFTFEERGRGLSVGGDVGKRGEMSGTVKVEQPALIGGPLCATGSFMQGASQQANEFVARLSTPRLFGQRLNWSFDVAKSSTDEAEASGYTSHVTHAVMRLTQPDGKHSITAETALRDLFPSENSLRLPSVEVLSSRLRSLKTSVKCSFLETWLLPPPSWWPACEVGVAPPRLGVRADAELAGFAGDVAFWRGECEAGASAALPHGLSLSCFGILGLLLQRDGQKSCLQDRFYLGGASGSGTILKGFAYRGIGPVGLSRPRLPASEAANKAIAKRAGDALGGNAAASISMNISAPLNPMLPADAQAKSGPFLDARVFSFAGLGALSLDHRVDAAGIVEGLRRGARATVGFGVGVPLGPGGMLELSFARPMWAQPHDVKQCWQLGMRLDWRS